MNVAIIGCGGMGAVHARCASACGLKIVACGDTVAKKAETLAAQYAADATQDCVGLVERKGVDIVAITTPTPWHVPYVIAAAGAGKHIFCEKPFGRTSKECRAALAAVKKARVKLFVGHVLRYFHEFEAMRQQIADGKVGEVGFVKMYRGGIFPMGEGGWFRDYAQSGGVTFDSSIHDFDWLRYVFGDAERVYCQALQRTEPEPIDYALATFRMKSGLIAQVIGTWAHPAGFRVKTEICGNNGMLTFDSAEAPVERMMRKTAGGGPGMIVPGSPVSVSPYQLEWQDFLSWLEGKERAKVTPEDALKAVIMAEAALKSAQSGKPVALH